MAAQILSVGIDIGTSTTQVIFSSITMENTSGFFSVPKVSIVDKEVIYKSDIYRTPLLNHALIDGDKVKQIVQHEFEKAGFSPADTNTGAVIITGESARKENAALVLEKLSSFAGDFVVSTAGPDLESIIAGKGSGAQQYSEEHGCTAANLDIGGGTTNIVVFDAGRVLAKGCLDIGGRQVRVSPDLTVEYISESACKIAAAYRLDLEEGKKTTPAVLQKLCEGMSDVLEQALGICETTPLLDSVVTAGSSELYITKPVRAVCFSGGVADCIYKTFYEDVPYGDIGVFLGRAIRNSGLFAGFAAIQPKETIRATVVGAGTYTTSISGSTIAYTNDIFPLKNIPVLKLNDEEQLRCIAGDAAFLTEKVKWFLEQNDSDKMVLAMSGPPNPSYQDIKRLAACIGQAMHASLKAGEPILIVMECDIAKVLGQTVQRLVNGQHDVISIDSIRVELNDYIDFGKPLMNGLVIPVVVKTLIFG